jgi:threonine/homoserine/homoserine lactone efflux protein
MNSVLLGFLSGIPLMIAIGPIGLLLVETGVSHGTRGLPAAAGVASADLVLATGSVVGGAGLAVALRPIEGALRLAGAAVLVWLAVGLALKALKEQPVRAQGPAARDSGVRTISRFFGLTMANPASILAFVSLVLAGGVSGVSIGWPIGILIASVMVHSAFVLVGAGVGSRLDERGVKAIRLLGAGAVLLLALRFALSPA